MTITSALGRAFGFFDDLIDLAMPAIRGMLVLLIGATVWFAFDRDEPYRLLAQDYPPPVVQPGGPLVLRGAVRRDVQRDCRLRLVSRMHFADGSRYDLQLKEFTAQELRDQEARTPGRVSIALDVPRWASAGGAYLTSTGYYTCNVTQHHELFPIVVDSKWVFNVAP